MRFLFLAFRDLKNPSAVGGDFYLWELAKGLSRLGHVATFVCSRFKGSRPSEIVDGVEVVRLAGWLSLPLRILIEYVKRFRGKVDVVVEEAIGGQRLPFLAGAYVRGPLVAVWHQRHDKIFHEQYPSPAAVFLSFFERFLARLYVNRIIVTPSKGAREKLMPLGFRSENVKVVYNGVDEIFYDAMRSEKREDLIVCLGKLRRYKRTDQAILALERVVHLIKRPCKLVIAGKVSDIDRSYADRLHDLAKRLRVADLVEFRVNIPEKEKLELLQKARILVQPSPVEGFSIVVAEANRCGTPVVVSDGVPRDVVVNGYNGLVYPFGDVSALATALSDLMKDVDLWERMSKNAYEWSKQFTWERSVIGLSAILDDICHERFGDVHKSTSFRKKE